MILFRTPVNVPESKYKLDYETPSLWIGSCFTENIGSRLSRMKFPVAINPFGIIYNPVSVKNSLAILLERRLFTEKDLFFSNGLWNSFFHHTEYSDPNLENCLQNINKEITHAHEFLKKSRFLFITFGTARVYQLKTNGSTVSNCHKLPHSNFNRKLLEVDEIVSLYIDLIDKLTKFNPGIKVVFTISPVRHWKDGAEGNQVSKSSLVLVIYRLREMFGNVLYFPAYEIVMDELRDYRFYDRDMLHVNDQGVDYIWEKFMDAFISPAAFPVIKKIVSINQGIGHRPFKPDAKDYREFLSKLLDKISEVERVIGSADFSKERLYIEQRIQDPDR